MDDGYKICPNCREEIKAKAIKCRYCLSSLDAGDTEKSEEIIKQDTGQNNVKADLDLPIHDVIAQLQKEIKKTHHYIYWLLAGLVILGFWLALNTKNISDQMTTQRAYYAESFILVDDEGNPRAALDSTDDNVFLIFMNTNDNELIQLGIMDGFTGLRINSDVNNRIALGQTDDSAALNLYNDDGTAIAYMGVEGDKISNTFYLNDNKMYNIISEEIGTVLGLSDADGNLLFMGLAIDGKPGLFLVDENENILFNRPN